MSRRNNRSSGLQSRFRQSVIGRANGVCEQCGTVTDPWKLTAHHIVGKADGGRSIPENGLALCDACHESAHSGMDAHDREFGPDDSGAKGGMC